MEHIKFFLFSCDWYDEYEDKEVHTKGLVAAKGFIEASEKITTRLPFTSSFFIKEMDDLDFIFLDQEKFELVDINGLGAFDEED